MTGDAPLFLPDRLRPKTPGRRSHRGLVWLSVVPFMLIAVPLWRVEHVRVDGCPKLPPSAVASLQELVGQPAIGLDVGAIKERVQMWPGVGEVRVDFVLPGTLLVSAETAPTLGSVRVGRSWHGVGADGGLTGRLQVLVEPVLEGFAAEGDRQCGLDAARRIHDAAGVPVAKVQRITPSDYLVEFIAAEGEAAVVVHVCPQGSAAERSWCAAFARGTIAQPWADLRWTDRIVIGGGV
ncbi:MAG: hypothetical protein MUP13_17025 [Thermoanaerobaculales bacterium]|nr:hypothetical protein [Thermoanaerobaculales bacterium]